MEFNEYLKKQKIRKIFKSLFICTVILSTIILSSMIIAALLCSMSLIYESFLFQVLIVIPYHLLSLTLSLTLFSRLWHVFKKTINKYYFITLLSLTFITNVVGIVGASLYMMATYQMNISHDMTNMEQNMQRAVSVSSIGHFGYIILSIWGLTLFTTNLDAAVMLRSKNNAELTDIDTVIGKERECTHSEIELNGYQLKLIYQQTKYMILLGIAMTSSILLYAFILIQGFFGEEYVKKYSFQSITIFESIDVIINVVCLYFQFSFADKRFKIIFGCLSDICYNSLMSFMITIIFVDQ